MKNLDFIGAALSVIDTAFFALASVWAWPLGLCAIAVNSFLYFKQGLYADMGLQAVYCLAFIYGWYFWCCGAKRHRAAKIQHAGWPMIGLLSVLAVLGTLLLHWLLVRWTSSQVPWWDATTTVLSLVAQWLVCRKVIENWLLWFVNDALYSGLYLYKGLFFHAFESGVYLIIAVLGYVRWRQLMLSAACCEQNHA